VEGVPCAASQEAVGCPDSAPERDCTTRAMIAVLLGSRVRQPNWTGLTLRHTFPSPVSQLFVSVD